MSHLLDMYNCRRAQSANRDIFKVAYVIKNTARSTKLLIQKISENRKFSNYNEMSEDVAETTFVDSESQI